MLENEEAAARSFEEISLGLRSALVQSQRGERNPYADGHVVALYIADLTERDQHSAELRTILDHIEELLRATPTDWMAAWVEIEILETLQNMVSNQHIAGKRSTTASVIFDLLGPISQRLWKNLNQFWGNSVDDL